MIKVISAILVVSLAYSAQVVNAKENNKDNSFIDKVQTADPDAQYDLDQLKKEFLSKRNQINDKYNIKKKTLKNQQKQEVDHLRYTYKKKLKSLQERYPKKIKRESRRHLKPLAKEDSRYLDPRDSDVNLKEDKVKKKVQKESLNPVKLKPKSKELRDKK